VDDPKQDHADQAEKYHCSAQRPDRLEDIHLTTPQLVGEGTEDERVFGAPITDDVSFVVLWPEVAKRLTGYLHRCKAPAGWIEDVIQEVGLRAFARSDSWPTADDLFWWGRTVAHNLVVDSYRAQSHVDFRELPTNSRSGTDVAAEVEARLTLERVVAAFDSLGSRDQEALRSLASSAGSDRQTQILSAVRRLRARQRLRAACEGLVGALLWLGRRVSRLRPRARQLLVFVVVPFGVFAMRSGRPMPTGVESHTTAEIVPTRGSSPAEVEVRYGNPPRRPNQRDSTTLLRPAPVAPSQAVLPHHVVVTTPAGRSVSITGREKRPDDHVLCVSGFVAGSACLDPPPLPVP
jgi:DNA-directed RNA polymerase specialized sigma24 family protein